MIDETDGRIDIDMCNLRLNTDEVCAGLENEDQFMREYAAGGKRSDPGNFRESVIELSGFSSEPSVTARGNNNAKMKTEWNQATGTLTVSVISNGRVSVSVS